MTNQRGETTLLGRAEEPLLLRERQDDSAGAEAVLRQHIRVAECAVVGLLEEEGALKLHAFVVPTAKGALLTEAELKTYCRAFVESRQVPARIHFQTSLPKSPDGQILREELRVAAQASVKRAFRRVKSAISELAVLQS